MTTYLSPNVRDSGLSYLSTHGARVDICSQAPATYADVATYSLGNYTAVTWTGPATTSGDARKLTMDAMTAAGSVTATGNATHYAITDGVGELLVVNALSATVSVVSGGTFSMSAADVTMPAETSA